MPAFKRSFLSRAESCCATAVVKFFSVCQRSMAAGGSPASVHRTRNARSFWRRRHASYCCTPVCVTDGGTVGRRTLATRHLRAGEIVLTEAPVLRGGCAVDRCPGCGERTGGCSGEPSGCRWPAVPAAAREWHRGASAKAATMRGGERENGVRVCSLFAMVAQVAAGHRGRRRVRRRATHTDTCGARSLGCRRPITLPLAAIAPRAGGELRRRGAGGGRGGGGALP